MIILIFVVNLVCDLSSPNQRMKKSALLEEFGQRENWEKSKLHLVHSKSFLSHSKIKYFYTYASFVNFLGGSQNLAVEESPNI